MCAQVMDAGVADYDKRTPIHLAAAEGHLAVVQVWGVCVCVCGGWVVGTGGGRACRGAPSRGPGGDGGGAGRGAPSPGPGGDGGVGGQRGA